MSNQGNIRKEDIVEVITIGDDANDILRLNRCTGVLRTEDGSLLYIIQVGGRNECAFARKGDRLCRLRNGRWVVERDGEDLVEIVVGAQEEGDGTADTCGGKQETGVKEAAIK